MRFQAFLIKYGEIGLKGKNRYMFEDALMNQIRFALKDVDGSFHVHKSQARIFVECEEYYDYEETVDALKRVFGLVGICPVVHVEDEGFDKLKEVVVDYMDQMYPDKNITANEAVAMILRAIGYDIQFSKGKSVREVAWDADIGSGLDFSAELTKEDVAQIIYDTLYADTLKANLNVGMGKAETVLYEFFGLQYMDGVVDGVDGKSLYGRSVPEDMISIDEVLYTVACEADESLLGKYVRFYYSEEDEEVRAIVPRKNTFLVINADSIIDSTNTEIVYYNENGKSKKAKIEAGADILYNGDVVNDISEYIPQNGEITLLDRKDNGVYDVVFIT